MYAYALNMECYEAGLTTWELQSITMVGASPLLAMTQALKPEA